MKNYKVQVGDTIAKVCLKHKIRVFDFLLFNPKYREYDYIVPNEIVNIPDNRVEPVYDDPYRCYAEYGHTDLEKDINEFFLSKDSPCTVNRIGNSVMNKPIYLIKIGKGKKKIFYSGGWHANEWMTSRFLVDFLKEISSRYEDNNSWHGYSLEKIFDEITLYVVPLVNPDGVELVHQGIYEGHPYYNDVLNINKGGQRFEHWSSNIRGVDLNHQWPAGWQIEADESPQIPWPRHYSGTSPLTEPEAIAIHQLTLQSNFSHVLAFHSQGQVIYWGYRNLEPKDSKELVTRLSLVSSYTPVHTADSDGGYKDWFIQETGRPGFTIEVGVGVNPLPFEAYGEIWTNNVLLALEGLLL